MPRIARVVIPGIAHHITQRGNYQQVVFHSDTDREQYLLWIKQYSDKYNLKFWAYCLMDNHVHFIVVPEYEYSMAKTFNQAHMRYSQYINWRMGKRGHLWQGRFYSCPLDDAHLYAAVRYVENNSVRAGLVQRPEDYHWSSALSHIEGVKDTILSNDLPLLRDIVDWREYLRTPDDNVVIERLRKCTSTGRPAGSKSFVKSIENRLGRHLSPQPTGRPRKRKE